MKLKKCLSCVLATLILISVAGSFGCSKNDGGESESESIINIPQESDTDAGDSTNLLKLVENGASEYVVVYPVKGNSSVMNAVEILIKSIEVNTGVKLKSKSDNLRGAESHDPNEKAILIGRTNYEESQKVYDTLGKFEYKIAQSGNKMVIAAWDDDQLLTAVQYYRANLIKENLTGEEGAKTLLLDEYHFIPEPNKNEFAVNGTDITEFSIIYPKDDIEYQNIGKELQRAIFKSMGVELPIYSDARAEGENEILLGKTNRSLSQSLYNDLKDYIMTYSFEVSGSKMQILSGGYYSALQCIADMSFFVLQNGKVNFTDGTHQKTKILSNPTALTDGADIRIMNANLLVSDWSDYSGMLDARYRSELFAGVLRDYQPDVVGLQEVCTVWRDELASWLKLLKEEYGLEYTFHHEKTPTDLNNPITIMYRSDKYNCVDEDYVIYSHWQPQQGTSIPMCRFQSKTDSSKEFIMMNTHWDPDTLEWVDKDNCSEEAAAFVNKWKSAGCPIFITGDWNAMRGRECLENFIIETDAKTEDTGPYCIEFTFYYGDGVTVKKNECLSQYLQMSDHLPRYNDFDLW